jgi:hypothetical protein
MHDEPAGETCNDDDDDDDDDDLLTSDITGVQ